MTFSLYAKVCADRSAWCWSLQEVACLNSGMIHKIATLRTACSAFHLTGVGEAAQEKEMTWNEIARRMNPSYQNTALVYHFGQMNDIYDLDPVESCPDRTCHRLGSISVSETERVIHDNTWRQGYVLAGSLAR